MRKILLITSSPRADASYSKKVGHKIAEKLLALHPSSTLTVRDLNSEPLHQINEKFVQAVYTPIAERTSEQSKTLEASAKLIEELVEADFVVIASGMINFSIPSTLKTWIDHICRAGVTFKVSPAGYEGLVKGKKVYLALASGGVYSTPEMQSYNFQEPYLRAVLGFLGMTDVDSIVVEGVSYGAEAAEKAYAAALEQVEALG